MTSQDSKTYSSFCWNDLEAPRSCHNVASSHKHTLSSLVSSHINSRRHQLCSYNNRYKLLFFLYSTSTPNSPTFLRPLARGGWVMGVNFLSKGRSNYCLLCGASNVKRQDRNTAKDCFNKGSREELRCASEERPCPDAELSQRADDVETLFGILHVCSPMRMLR